MKTILCPVDFSPASRSVAQYAAEMARNNEAKVILSAINPHFQKVPAGDWDERQEAIDRLGEWRDWINSRHHARCGVEEEIILHNVYKNLSEQADKYDLMVMGMPGSKAKYPTALDPIKTLRETLAPLLIVPEKYEYRKIDRLLYAYDYTHEPEPPLLQLRFLADWFGAEVRFISILSDEMPIQEEDKYYDFQDKLSGQWNCSKKLSFQTILYHDVSRCLEHYLSLWQRNDLLVLSINHQSIMEKIWHKSVIKQLLKYGNHPYLILHK